ncbi:MAG: hypothetical protein JWN40_2361 [Phycisphaerales bacterium]|nr:hypothetical protein [Phycisphaerales bacterium]
MIRFACDTCRRTLRAPDSLAGKRGKCARCGGVNRVPAPLSVDVKRAAEPSPFRNPDQPVRGAIEGAIELAGGRFLAVAPASAISDAHDAEHEHPHDFYDQVAPRLGDDDPRFSADVNPPAPGQSASSTRRANSTRGSVRHDPLESRAPHTADAYEMRYDARHHDFTRAVSAALVVGAAIGFCIGLIASRWIL